MKKKILSVVVCVAMLITTLFTAVAIPVSAANTASFTVGSVSGAAGETVTVNFDVAASSYLASADFIVNFDSTALQVVGCTVNESLLTGMYTNNLLSAGEYVIAYASDADTGITAAGTLFSIQFKILSSNVTSASVKLTVDSCEGINGGSEFAITPAVTNGTITVEGGVDANNLLVYDRLGSVTGATVTELEDGSWLIESTGAAEIVLNGPGVYDASTLKYVHLAMNSNVNFTMDFYDAVNNGTMTSTGDFSNKFTVADGWVTAAPYGSLGLYLLGYYEWNFKDNMPATYALSTITIKMAGAGKMVISHLSLADADDCDVAAPSLDVTKPSVSITEPTTTTTTPEPVVTTPPTSIPDREMEGEQITYAVVVSNSTVTAGDTITVDFTVSEGHYMVNGQVNVRYDATKLEIQEVWDDLDNPYYVDHNTTIFTSKYMAAFKVPTPGEGNFAFASSASRGTTTGGTMFTLTFKVLEGWEGDTAISLDIPEMCSNSTGVKGEDYNTNVLIQNAYVTIPGETTPSSESTTTTTTTRPVGTANVLITDGEAKAGEQVTVEVVVDADEVASMQLKLEYDATKLTLVEAALAGQLSTLDDVNNQVAVAVDPEHAGQIWLTLVALDELTLSSDNVLTLAFTVAADAEPGTIAIESVYEMITNSELTEQTVAVDNGTITVVEDAPSVVPSGDVDGNGKVELLDAVKLFQYLNGQVLLDEDALIRADVVTNGKAELLDAVRLFQYLNGQVDTPVAP